MDAPKLWRTIATGILVFAMGAGFAYAKLPQPPMDEAAKVKAKEARAKDIEAAKKDAEQLANAQDRIAERYKKEMKLKGASVQPVVEKFALRDVDKDGCIDRTEAESVPELMAEFRALDANYDSRLCASELREWATKQRTAPTTARKK